MDIFLDLDGVLVNFQKGACKLFGVDEEKAMANWKPGQWDMGPALNLTDEEFYSTIERAGQSYWEALESYPWADELYHFCCSLARTHILTMPTYDADCLAGKVKWLQRWKGKGFRDYILTPHKEVCARWDRVLIDDKDENCEKFIKAGGKAIVFPLHTNSRHALKNDPMKVVKPEIEEVIKLITKESK